MLPVVSLKLSGNLSQHDTTRPKNKVTLKVQNLYNKMCKNYVVIKCSV